MLTNLVTTHRYYKTIAKKKEEVSGGLEKNQNESEGLIYKVSNLKHGVTIKLKTKYLNNNLPIKNGKRTFPKLIESETTCRKTRF